MADRSARRRPAPDGSGHGLIGMRERVELWGGELAAGPLPGGGYRVQAMLPYGDADMTIRVVVADDQALVRSGVRRCCSSSEPDIEVVGEAEQRCRGGRARRQRDVPT